MNLVFRSLSDFNYDARNSVVLFITAIFMLSPLNVAGQKKCNNPPVVRLGESNGTTCYRTPITVNDNTFGGSATAVTITADSRGDLSPSSTTSSPFAFTYTPNINDAGNVVTITVTTNNPLGAPCKEATATYRLSVVSGPSAPNIVSIIQPTCLLSTGSVELDGLPSYADWTITVNPDGMTTVGSGTTATISNLPAGTYTFTVSLSTECISLPSQQAVIDQQPVIPPPPIPGTITGPTCTIATGSVIMLGLPATGTWTLIRYPGTVRATGTGTSATISGIPPGTYNFSITNAAGCVSSLSGNVIIPAQPPSPGAPVIDAVIQPTLQIPTGSVKLTNLPATGPWTILRSPGGASSSGTGTTFTITGLAAGTYTFRVMSDNGCISTESAAVVISAPAKPVVLITDPLPVCYPATADLTLPEITAGSTSGLIFSYWMDDKATVPLETPRTASDGIYYIKGTASSGFFDIKPVNVSVIQPPVSNAGPDQVLAFQFNTILGAVLGVGESGTWYSNSDTINFSDVNDPGSAVSNLSQGVNVLSWVVTNAVCPADTDELLITVGEPLISTLITPNGDSKNEYFIISGLELFGRTELTVFDRRGMMVFQNSDYDNKWNGVDYNNDPLVNDTYFFVLKSLSGKSYSGYVVVRK